MYDNSNSNVSVRLRFRHTKQTLRNIRYVERISVAELGPE